MEQNEVVVFYPHYISLYPVISPVLLLQIEKEIIVPLYLVIPPKVMPQKVGWSHIVLQESDDLPSDLSAEQPRILQVDPRQ